MKKILFPLLLSNKGGNILSTISICNKINNKKFNSHLLLISYKKKIGNERIGLKLNKNIKIDTIFVENRFFFFNIFLYFKLITFLFKNRFDIIHTNDGKLNFHFSFLCFFFRINHILHLRNSDNSRRNYISYILAKKIICISQFVKNQIPLFLKDKKVVLYNYVEFFNTNIKLKNNHKNFIKINKNKNFLLFISNIHKRKNPKIFIDTIDQLNKIDKSYFGLMFFQSEKKNFHKLNKYIKSKNINKKIYIFRNYPIHYWVELVKKLNKKILFAPSHKEPLGRNIIEAILKNIFVIANNSGGHKEIIDKNNGILIDIYSKNLAMKIHYMFLKLNNNSKFNNSKKKFADKFQNKKYIKIIEKIYLD